MSESLRGLALLDAAIEQIETHPETWEQSDFRCETGMCVAGWVAQLGGGKWLGDPESSFAWYLAPEPEDHPDDVVRLRQWAGVTASARAIRLIGCDPALLDDDAPGAERYDRHLFDGGNDLYTIRQIRDRIAEQLKMPA